MKGISRLLLIGWLVLIAGGIALNRLSPFRPVEVEPVWVAARDLPANTHLAAEDLEMPQGLVDARNLPPLDRLVGKYLWEDIPSGSEVKAAHLHDRPQMPDTAVTYLYPLTQAEAGLAKVLVPGDQVSVCVIGEAGDGPPCSGPLDVITIHIGKSPEEQWLLLDVSSHEHELGHVLGVQQHIVLRLVPTDAGEPELPGQTQ